MISQSAAPKPSGGTLKLKTFPFYHCHDDARVCGMKMGFGMAMVMIVWQKGYI